MQQQGVTLLELVVVLAVVAVVTVIAVPVSSYAVQSYQLTSAANDLVASLHMARNEALRSGGNVIVCPRVVNDITCDDGQNWSNGWLVKRNQNCQDEACVLAVWPALASGQSLRSTGDSELVFNSRGLVQFDNRSFRICSEMGYLDTQTRVINVGYGGQIEQRDADGSCG